ncbi:retrovirus-related pol polyprotein from transposon TNT 1-94 [Tanacetum coccineum]|uniref:Retrovirus-related pol polyprotein from transposon TNT 1-94 n=1 Tax=Tanacetum coccineum TaxID=301880 RepID=A0ABQ5BHQ7_9ASTR
MSSNSDDIQADGSDTRPPMLDRTDYDSWSQQIWLYCLPKDIYKLINHNIEAKAIWDNVKMLLAGSELTKEDRESQLYDEFERFKMLPGENINEYYVWFHKLFNDMRNIRMTMPNIQLNSKFVNNMSPEWDREMVQQEMREHIIELGMPMQVKESRSRDKMLLMQAQENGAVLDEEELLFLVGEQANTFDAYVDNQPVRDLALNKDNIFQSIFMANLSSVRPANQQAGLSNASILSKVLDLENAIDTSDNNQVKHEIHNEVQQSTVIDSTSADMEVRAMKIVFENMEAEVDQNAIDKKCGEIKHKNLLIMNEKLIANCIAQDVFYTVTASALSASYFHDLSTAYNVAMNHVGELESENSKLLGKIQHDNHDTMVKDFSKLEVAHLNLQLKYQHLKETIENFKSKSSKDAPKFDTFFELGIQDDKIQALQEQLEHFKAENEKVKQYYQELFNSIKVTRVKTIKRTTSLQTEIENLKTQLKGKMPCVTNNIETSKVSAVGSRQLRKKHVTFADPLETSGTNTINHVKQLTVQNTNVPIIHSTGVINATKARRSKSKNNTMHDKTLPAKSVPEKKVEDHHRKNKSKLSKQNRVDSSTSVRSTVFNTNSNSLYKTCNECTISLNHDKCVANSLKSSKSPLVKKIWRVKQVKQTWKPTSKVFTTVGHCWKPTGRIFPLGGQCPLVRPTALNNATMLTDPQANTIPVVQIVLWYLDSGCLKHMTGDRSRLRNFVKKFIGTVRFRNDHFGAIMGYGDYVIGDSVISRVYYVEGLGHNLFSVGQFCDSDLEVAFRKHTCFVRDLDGVDLIKGSHGTNLYTISVEDMMRSSPICLLSKASKNKSWLWHLCLNHLNFGKSKKATHKPKTVNTIMEVLHTLPMDLCGPIRVQSINGKKYILVIVDDYSRFTWVMFLRTKDETPKFVIKLLKQLQVGLNKTVKNVCTDNGTEFVNKDLIAYYESVGITHEKTISRTPQQNGVVE